MSRTPIITVLGSATACQPLHELADAGLIQTRQHGIYAHTRNTKEHLQIIRYLRGDLELPEELLRYLCEPIADKAGPRDGAGTRDILSGTDILVIEMSSLKELRFRDWILSPAAVRARTVEDHPELVEWWERINGRCAPQDDAPEPAWEGATAIDQDVIRELRVVRQDAVTVKRDMEEISTAFGGTILWLTGYPAVSESDDAPQEREWIVSWTQRGAKRLGLPVHDVADGGDLWASALRPLTQAAA